MKSKNTKQVEKMWTAQDEEMLSYCSDYLDEKQIEWLESIKQRLSAQTNLLMDYEKVLGEHKFPTYEELKTGLIRLIDDGKISREDASRLLPELRESENEKIRTLLVALVQWAKTFNQSGLDPNTVNKMLSYLEKQKEQKPAEEIKDQRQIYFMIEDGRRCGVIEGRKQVIDNPEKYGLQKPAEWSEEDEKIMQTMIKEGDLKPSEIAWLKSLRPQPKQEVTDEEIEEVEQMVNRPGVIYTKNLF